MTSETRQPITENFLTVPAPQVILSGSSFIFSGKIAIDPEGYCLFATEQAGGMCARRVDPTLDYVVVGRLGNRNWKYRNYGKKIEEALYINSLTEQGKEIDKKYFRSGRSNTTIKIVTEDAWFEAFKKPIERTTPNNHNIFWGDNEITKSYLNDRTINCEDFIQRLFESAKNPRVEASVNWIDDIRPYIEDCIGGQVSPNTTFKKYKDVFEIFNKKQYVVSVAYNKYEGEVIDFVLPGGSLADEAFSTRDQYQEFLKELRSKLE